jgi:nucleoid DNA-binding protein
MNNKFIKAFREVVRDEVVKKNSIEIEGLGRFEIRHNKQHQKKMKNGQVLMMPPEDIIIFTPEKRDINEN